MPLRKSAGERTAREVYPRAKQPDSHVFISITRGGRNREFAVPAFGYYAGLICLPFIAAVYLGASAYMFFRDDMISALMARQAHQQYAYEDRLAALRLQFDDVASRQMLDQDSFEGKLREIASRQAQIESRGAVVASLVSRIGMAANADQTGSLPARSAKIEPPAAAAAIKSAVKKPIAAAFPGAAQAFAPQDGIGSDSIVTKIAPNPRPSIAAPVAERPHPVDDTLRSDDDPAVTGPRVELPAPQTDTLAMARDPDAPTRVRIQTLASSLDFVERKQIAALATIERPAMAEAARLRAALAETGLSIERIAPKKTAAESAMGGPFIPFPINAKASPFDAELSRAQDAIIALDRFKRVLPLVPIRKPLLGALEQTSGFGYRTDPFLGRPALHSGLDFRGDYGSSVRATAGGVVTNAGPAGGYGNMVEVDHGNGLSTRYGHLSAILVSEGQKIEAGATVGRMGSTGRSTGTHLHYEVRIDDEPVDPTRFIRAARMLAGD